MIRIKAPRVWRLGVPGYRASYYRETRMGAAPGRWISEAMKRRYDALVRACDNRAQGVGPSVETDLAVFEALELLREQAEKEAK